jgi:hypothetical protein
LDGHTQEVVSALSLGGRAASDGRPASNCSPRSVVRHGSTSRRGFFVVAFGAGGSMIYQVTGSRRSGVCPDTMPEVDDGNTP